MNGEASNQILNLILGGGAVTTIGALVKGVQAIKAGSRTNVRDAIGDLEKWREDSDDVREWEAAQHQWWRDWAWKLSYALTTRNGPESLPLKEPYPTRAGRGELR